MLLGCAVSDAFAEVGAAADVVAAIAAVAAACVHAVVGAVAVGVVVWLSLTVVRSLPRLPWMLARTRVRARGSVAVRVLTMLIAVL